LHAYAIQSHTRLANGPHKDRWPGRDLLLRAAEEHISVSEAIRRAARQYLQAS